MRPDEHNPHSYDPATNRWTCSCGLVYTDSVHGSRCPNRHSIQLTPPRLSAGPSDEEVAAAIASIQGVT